MAAWSSPSISSDPPVAQNLAGDKFDLNTVGTPLRAHDPLAGFGDFGEIYFNVDATNLFVGGVGVDPGGTNNVLVLFLGTDTLSDDARNLWHKSGLPNTLDAMHNVAFSDPMDIAIVFGDEYGDSVDYTNFMYAGYDFGQGIYYIGTNSLQFSPLPGARLSQFDGTGGIPCVSDDDDGNRQTDRWEAAIPWSALNAPSGAVSLARLMVAGVIASDAVSGNNRYLSATYVGEDCTGFWNAAGNYGYGFVQITPVPAALEHGDFDGDFLPNTWEHAHFGSSAGPDAGDDSDGDGFDNRGEYVAGTDPTGSTSRLWVNVAPDGGEFIVHWPSVTDRVYAVQQSSNLLEGFDTVVSNLGASLPTNSHRVAGDGAAFYRIDADFAR